MDNAQDYGLTTQTPFAYYDHTESSWRTSQHSLIEDLTVYSQTWPRAGTMRNGIAYQRRPSAHRTYATEYSLSLMPPNMPKNPSGLVPTPVADGDRTTNYAQGGASLGAAVRNGLSQEEQISGLLNPTWVEWLMGFPIGWTDYDASVTPSYHK